MFKRAVMRAGAQMNGFLSTAERPSACKRVTGRFLMVLDSSLVQRTMERRKG